LLQGLCPVITPRAWTQVRAEGPETLVNYRLVLCAGRAPTRLANPGSASEIIPMCVAEESFLSIMRHTAWNQLMRHWLDVIGFTKSLTIYYPNTVVVRIDFPSISI